MFDQFIPTDESTFRYEFLGTMGFWGLGTHSFACLTDRRFASLRIGAFGEVIYQDAFLENFNSGVVHQPSKLILYVLMFILIIAIPFTLGISLLFIPLVGKYYYMMVKCGVVLWIREGVPVYVFSDRKRIGTATALYKEAVAIRERRIHILGKSGSA